MFLRYFGGFALSLAKRRRFLKSLEIPEIDLCGFLVAGTTGIMDSKNSRLRDSIQLRTCQLNLRADVLGSAPHQ